MSNTDIPLPISEYEKLVAEVTAKGLFKRTYWHYGICAGIALGCIGASFYMLTLTHNALIQALNGLLFAFGSVQLGMIGHDLSHGEVFESKSVNRFFSTLQWGLFGGLSEGRWYDKHNAHHKHPNHMEHDPDLEIPFIFSHKQVEARTWVFKHLMLPYQHYLFFLALPLIYPANIAYSMAFIFTNISPRTAIEILLMIAHFAILLFMPFFFLPAFSALVFLVVSFTAIGAYMSMAFAPNHKGEHVLGGSEQFNWTHQITLTRNIYPSWPVFYLLGGLNFQIEHHLFPTMSRLNYWRARDIVKKFCAERAISYHETTWLESMKEIHDALKEEALAWRAREK